MLKKRSVVYREKVSLLNYGVLLNALGVKNTFTSGAYCSFSFWFTWPCPLNRTTGPTRALSSAAIVNITVQNRFSDRWPSTSFTVLCHVVIHRAITSFVLLSSWYMSSLFVLALLRFSLFLWMSLVGWNKPSVEVSRSFRSRCDHGWFFPSVVHPIYIGRDLSRIDVRGHPSHPHSFV